MIDRTKELQNQGKSPPSYSASTWESVVDANNAQIEIEMAALARGSNESENGQNRQDIENWMSNFFLQVTKIQSGLADLEAKLPVIERIQGKILSSFQDAEEKKFHAELDDLTSLASSLAYTLNNLLSDMDKQIQRNITQVSTDYRLCMSQHAGLSRKLRSIVLQYQNIQKIYQDKQKARFTRQYRIINPDVTSEQIAEMLSNDYHGQQIFAESVLSATMMDEAKRVLIEVKQRHKEIISLSKSIVGLERLFEELSMLIEQQDDLVNQVAYQTDNAVAYMGEANATLVKANRNARGLRRRRWCLVFSCLILVGILATVIALVIVPRLKN